MKINVRNIGSDSFTDANGNTFVSNSVDIDIGGRLKIALQRSVPNQRELAYSQGTGITIGNPLFQTVKQVKNLQQFRTQVGLATTHYKDLLLSRPASLGNWFLQYPQSARLTPTDRLQTHNIQVNAGALAISDLEINREQPAADFETDIMALRKQYPNHIVCPTIDVGIKTNGLFAEKVDKVIGNGFDMFNVVYRSIPENFVNWIDLPTKLLGKNIWCNVVGVLPRWYGKTERISQISRTFLFGVHSSSLGLPWSGSQPKPTRLNQRTLCFDIAPAGTSYEFSRTAAVVTQDRALGTARSHTMGSTFFRNFVPSTYGLNRSLDRFL